MSSVSSSLSETFSRLITTNFVRSQLFGIAPNDPGTILVSTLVLLAAGILAGVPPAKRATTVEPMVALRAE